MTMTEKRSQNPPKVSVFISSYNHASYLTECLDSILAQTYEDFEVVIIDDGSSDDSHQILSGYQERHPDKIHYFWHPGHANRGISISCNLALERTRGEYLAWCGSDDVWEPDKLRQQAQFLDTNPQMGLVYARVSLIDSSGKPIPGKLGIDITHEPNPIARLLEGNWIHGTTVVMRRSCLDQVGLFDEGLVYSDWELWFRILSFWKIGYQPAVMARYRLHNSNVSAGIDPRKNRDANIRVLEVLREKAAADSGLLGTLRNRALIKLWLSYHYFMNGMDDLAVEHLRGADTIDPSLRQDDAFMIGWFRQLARQNYNSATAYKMSEDFPLHVLEYAEAGQIAISGELRKELAFLKLSSQTIQYYQDHALREARTAGLKSLFASPTNWLRYRTQRGILLETLTGALPAATLRRFKRRIFFKRDRKSA